MTDLTALKTRLDDWRPIETAPRDGTVILVTDHETFTGEVRWNPMGTNVLVSKDIGIWECPGGNFTWCEDDGFGPTHWKPALLAKGGEQ